MNNHERQTFSFPIPYEANSLEILPQAPQKAVVTEVKVIVYEFDQPLQSNTDSELSNTYLPVFEENAHDNEELDIVTIYLNQIAQIPLLTAEQEFELGTRVQAGHKAREKLLSSNLTIEEQEELLFREQDGKEAADYFTNSNLRLAVSVAKKYCFKGIPFPDLIQEANIGIMKAVNKYDPEKGIRFSTYGYRLAELEVRRAIADDSRLIRLPVYMHDALIKLRKASGAYAVEHGKEADRDTLESIFRQWNESHSISFDALIAVMQGSAPLSLDQPITNNKGDDIFRADIVSDKTVVGENDVLDVMFNSSLLGRVRKILSPREWEVICLRFGLEDAEKLTLAEVGVKIGVTRERVRQIQDRAIKRLQNHLNKDYDE